MLKNICDSLCFEPVESILAEVLVVCQEHDGLVPEVFLRLMIIETSDTLHGLPGIHAADDTVIFIKQVVDTARWDVGKSLGFGNHRSRYDNGHERFTLNTTNPNALGIAVYELHDYGFELYHLLYPICQATVVATSPE